MFRWFLYPLGLLFAVSLVANLLTQDWDESKLMFGLLVGCASIIGLFEWRDSIRWNKVKKEFVALEGLENCPITNEQLLSLFQFLDRPDPPPCTHRMDEAYCFLNQNGLEIEQTLKWLNANGAGCDCEIIFNTAMRYGEEVGFEPESE